MPSSYNLGFAPEDKDKDRSTNGITIIKKDSNGTSTQNGVSDSNDSVLSARYSKGDKPSADFDEIDLKGKDVEDNAKSKKEDVKPKGATFGEMFSYATGFDKFLIFVGSLASLGHGAAWPLMMLVFGKMTNNFVYYGVNQTMPGDNTTLNFNISMDDLAEEFEDEMTDFALQYVYIGIGVGIVTYIQITFWQISCERQTYQLRLAFFKALLRQNIGWYDQHQSGDLTTKLAGDLERVRDGLGDKVALSMQFIAQFISGFAIGFTKGWKMTLVIMSLSPLLAFSAAALGKLTVSYSTLEQMSYAKAGAVAEEVLSCIRTVTSFNGQVQEMKKYSQALSKCMRFGVKKSLFAGLSVGLMLLIMFCAYGLAFWFGSTQVNEYNKSHHEDGYSPGDVLAIFFSVMVGSFALGSASPHIATFLAAKGAGGTVFPIIKDTPPIDSSNKGGKKPSSVQGRIQFKNVGFAYPTRLEAKILHDFSLDIEPGQTVALVGASGCGKSTIVNLIQRFYDPDEGVVLLDGEDIRDLNISWLRGNIGIVSQEPILFGMSIAHNIQLGNPGISQEEVEKASRMANAHEFISSLPDGYNTLVGERGAQLSGGQKQRVAIARALVRDPSILLLDEATSALDSESEGIVQAALDKAGVGRTTVIIAHRLSTIQNADVIYVLEEGKVVEMGRHHELMDNQGPYYKLVTLQMIAAQKDEEDEEAAGNAMPRKRSFHHQTSKKRSDSGPKRSFSRQESSDSASKEVNLFKKKGTEPVEEEVDESIEPAGFGRILKSNFQEWPLIVFGCFAAMINGAIFPAFSFIFSEIIKTFSKTGDELLDDGLLWSMLFVGLGGVAFAVNLIQNVSFGYSGERLTHRLRNQAFTNIVRQDIVYFDDPKHSTGALTTRLATDATLIKTATGIRLAMIVQSITSMVAGLTIAFVYGWKLAFAVLGGVPIIMLAGAINMKVMRGNQLRDSALLEDAGKIAGECVENIRTVQGLTREQHFYDLYSEKLMRPYKENVKQAHIYGISFAFSQCIFFFLYAAAYRFGAWLVVNDDMSPDLVFSGNA